MNTPVAPVAGVSPEQLQAWLDEHLAAAPPLSKRQREAIAALLAHHQRRHAA